MKGFFGGLLGFGIGTYLVLGPFWGSLSNGERVFFAMAWGMLIVGFLWLISWLRNDPSRNSDYILAERERPNVFYFTTYDNSTHRTSHNYTTNHVDSRSITYTDTGGSRHDKLTVTHQLAPPRRSFHATDSPDYQAQRRLRAQRPVAGYLEDKSQ